MSVPGPEGKGQVRAAPRRNMRLRTVRSSWTMKSQREREMGEAASRFRPRWRTDSRIRGNRYRDAAASSSRGDGRVRPSASAGLSLSLACGVARSTQGSSHG